MIESSVQLDPRQVRQVRRGYGRAAELLPKAINRAIPIVGRKARVATVRAIAGNVNVRQAKLYQRGNRRRPVRDRTYKVGELVGYRMTIDKGRIPLGRFNARQHWRKGQTRGRVRSRVSYKIDKSGARRRVTDAFLLEFSSGYEGVYRRQGSGRLPLVELYGPSIPHVAERDKDVRDVMDRQAGDNLVAEVESRLDWILSRAA